MSECAPSLPMEGSDILRISSIAKYLVALVVVMAICTGSAFAALVQLPDSTSATTLTATVAEQCDITVPAGIAFDVTDVDSTTDSAAQSVTIDKIVLTAATSKLKVSIKAGAADFTPSVGGAVTWAASDVSWDAGTWTNGTGATGTLSSAAFNEVATSDAGVASLSVADLVFTLAAKNTVIRSGDHTLACTWKVERVD